MLSGAKYLIANPTVVLIDQILRLRPQNGGVLIRPWLIAKG